MPKSRKIGYKILCAAVFIILEIAAFAMLRKSSELQDIWLSRLSHKVMTVLWGSSQNISYYFQLKTVNEDLAEENFKLNEELRKYRLTEDFREVVIDDNYEYLPSRVIKISNNKQHNYLILDKGYEDGVSPQDGVVTSEGVIGIIDAVERHFSFAISFMNSEVSVSARIGHEGGVGPLYWDGKNAGNAILKEIPLQQKFKLGDTVWTSGISEIFPSDIPLGIIKQSQIINGAVNECTVELFEDFLSLKYVSIVKNMVGDEILNLENYETE